MFEDSGRHKVLKREEKRVFASIQTWSKLIAAFDSTVFHHLWPALLLAGPNLMENRYSFQSGLNYSMCREVDFWLDTRAQLLQAVADGTSKHEGP